MLHNVNLEENENNDENSVAVVNYFRVGLRSLRSTYVSLLKDMIEQCFINENNFPLYRSIELQEMGRLNHAIDQSPRNFIHLRRRTTAMVLNSGFSVIATRNVIYIDQPGIFTGYSVYRNYHDILPAIIIPSRYRHPFDFIDFDNYRLKKQNDTTVIKSNVYTGKATFKVITK